MHSLLEPGDIIREGDEYYSLRGTWGPVFLNDICRTVGADDLYRRHLGPWEAVRHALESIPDTDATTATKAYMLSLLKEEGL